jgi:hypothetical protein
MLTNHNYIDIIEKWDEADEYKAKIKDCCKKEGPDDTNCTDCCYDTWRAELKDIVQVYTQEKELADQLEKRLVFITDRRNRYKTWLDELIKAEEYATAICYQLDLLAGQSQKIWYNACNAVEAIEILFCMIREFYGQVDYLKTRYDELQNCISKNNDPSLEKGKGILGCLDKYFEKLDAIIKTRDEIIKAVIEAIKLANLLRNNIYTLECPGDEYDPCKPETPCNCKPDEKTPSEYGFKTIICEWYCAFRCDEPCPEPDPCKDQQQIPQPKPPQTLPVCEVDCELNPSIEFPICKDTYKLCVDKWYREDDKTVRDLSKDLNEKNKTKESLLACKQSLDKAIAEADPKIRCK